MNDVSKTSRIRSGPALAVTVSYFSPLEEMSSSRTATPTARRPVPCIGPRLLSHVLPPSLRALFILSIVSTVTPHRRFQGRHRRWSCSVARGPSLVASRNWRIENGTTYHALLRVSMRLTLAKIRVIRIDSPITRGQEIMLFRSCWIYNNNQVLSRCIG